MRSTPALRVGAAAIALACAFLALAAARGADDPAVSPQLSARAAQRDAAAQQSPNDPALWYAAGRSLEAMGRYDDAWVRYRNAIIASHGDPRYWNAAVRMYDAAGLHDAAAAILEKRTAVAPADAGSWQQLAGELFALGRYGEAAAAVDEAALLAPAGPAQRAFEAQNLLLSGRPYEAERIYEQLPTRATAPVVSGWYLSALLDGSGRAALIAPVVRSAAVTPADRAVAAVLVGDSTDISALHDPASLARVEAYLAVRARLAGDTTAALQRDAAAIATGQVGLLEYALAQVESQRLNGERATAIGTPILIGAVVVVIAILALLAFRLVQRMKRSWART